MIVHVGASYQNMAENIPFLRRIIGTIHESGDTVARDWVELVASKVDTDRLHKEDWATLAAENLDALERSDVAIIEITGYGFWDGYTASRALEMGKSVLLLGRFPVDAWMVSGLRHKLLTLKEYKTEQELAELVGAFLATCGENLTQNHMDYQAAPGVIDYLESLGATSDEAKSTLLNTIVRGAQQMPAREGKIV